MNIFVANQDSDRSWIYLLQTRTVIAHGYICNKPGQWSFMDIFVANQDIDRSWIYLLQTRKVIAHGYICNKPGQWSLMDIFVTNQDSDCSWIYLIYIQDTNIYMSDHCPGLLQIYPWVITVLVCYKYIHERSLSWFVTNISMSDHFPGLLQICPWSITVLVCYKYVHETRTVIAHGYIFSKPGQWSLMDIFVTNQDSDRSWIYF
jgi:uncharacterized protein with HEPN domain